MTFYERFEDTKRVSISRKSKKDTQSMVKRNNKMGENNNGQQNIFCVEDIITRVICYCLPLDTKCGAVTQTS